MQTTLRRWLHSARARRGLALGLVVLATGGLVLARSEAGLGSHSLGIRTADGGSSFSGPGASGSLALSHGKLLSSGEQTVFAELLLTADDDRPAALPRTPLSIAIVFDTSGSMSGDKIETSKRSVVELLNKMRPEDEVAFVRYDDESELMQPLAPVSSVRSELIERVQSLSAGGGTNIPPALERGMRALESARSGRVKRVMLVSDGLDSNRTTSERLARNALDSRVTVSALGIGLDFDEGYLSSVASSGRGNFTFVEEGSALAGFLGRELDETANTLVDVARARLSLPRGMRFVRVVGAELDRADDGEVSLVLGSLYAGDTRRVVVELAASAEHGERLSLGAQVDWELVGGKRGSAELAPLELVGERDQREVERAINGRVYASAISATASLRQLAATEAFSRGEGERAQALIDENIRALATAKAVAPEAAPIEAQLADVERSKQELSAPAGSPKAKAAAKVQADRNSKNLSRQVF